ncbi:protein spaetzle-like isoform X2 [Topomyia yanbarensis]|uniref:protein spaetzle-like isoform X2 n=1 Tax=Topomyia yanbarensis TaxID=2498891 RepID=UPI00273BE67E|nr:protein spaetzle-like isoform X2 [Topomyia yanbarensis]XP_058812843.1 protein spaetzle-like isoform X2 [Topomyia yanbarensis]
MIQKVSLAIWLSSGLVIILLFMCTTMLMPTNSAAQFRPLVRQREEEATDEELKTRIQEIYKRKGYTNPEPDPEDYPEESMPIEITARLDSSTTNRTRRPMQKLSKDFDPSQSYVIKHANGTISYVFPEKIASTTAGTSVGTEKSTSDVTYRSRRCLDKNCTSEKSDFVFPNELVPKVDTEHCQPDEPICTAVIDYPEQVINEIIAKHGERYSEVFGDDVLVSNGDKLVQRFDTSDDEFLCNSEERLVHPKSGLTKDDYTVMIVNTRDYLQGVRVETCRNAGKPCDNLDVGNIYQTECKQLYHYRTLLAINPYTNEPYKELFRLPSCCKCVRKPVAGILRKRREAEGL